MKRQKIGTIFFITFSAMIFSILLIAVGDYFVIKAENESRKTLYNNYGKVQGDVAMGLAYFQTMKNDLRNVLYIYPYNNDLRASYVESIETAKNNMEATFARARAALIDDDLIAEFDQAHESVNTYLGHIDKCLTYVSQNEIDRARGYLRDDVMASGEVTTGLIETLVKNLDGKAMAMMDEGTRTHEMFTYVIGVLLLFIFIGVILIARMLIRALRDPMLEIAEIAKKAALGDIEQNVQRIENSKNEIALLQNSFCDMIDNLKLQAIALSKLSDGNFNIDYTPASDRDHVGKALEKLIKDNNTAFAVIRSATKQITVGSEQIAAASQTLAQGSTQQASAIEQISSSITDISNKTKNNAMQAKEVNGIIKETKNGIILGNERMDEMVAAMKEINEASENIQKIIKVIDDIAFNTNILALNAAVEAARAGEQGKGFAVVAEEVRSLAGRSAHASHQTAEMIEDSIAKVRRGSELAMETAKSLDQISSMIDNVTGLSDAIVAASGEQAEATDQIDQALVQVSQVVQTNSATSQECASASEELSGQAAGLQREISKFKLKGGTVSRQYTPLPAPAQPYAAPAQALEYQEPKMIGSSNSRY